MKGLGREGKWEDVKGFCVVDTGVPAARRNGRCVWSTDFCTKKKSNLHRLSLLNSSIIVWNSKCEEYLNKHVLLKKFQPAHSYIPYLWILISFILSSHLPFQNYNGFKLTPCPARLPIIQLQQAKISLPETENQSRYMDVSATALVHSQPAVSTDRDSSHHFPNHKHTTSYSEWNKRPASFWQFGQQVGKIIVSHSAFSFGLLHSGCALAAFVSTINI